MNLIVAGLSRDAQKRTKLKTLGADFVFDPGDKNLVKSISVAIGPKKADLGCGLRRWQTLTPSHCPSWLWRQDQRRRQERRHGPRVQYGDLAVPRICIGGVSVGDYTAQAAQTAWKEIVDRLKMIGHRPLVDSIVSFEEVKKGFARLAQGPMGKSVGTRGWLIAAI